MIASDPYNRCFAPSSCNRLTCAICITDRLRVMSEPLQLVSSAGAAWQMYITSFPLPLSFFVLNDFWTARYTNTSTSSPFVRISPRCFVLHIQLINWNTAFLFYDHFVTLGGFSKFLDCKHWRPNPNQTKKGVEIELVWRRPLHISRWFFLNRYFAFFGNVAVLVISFVHLSPAMRFSIFSLAL